MTNEESKGENEAETFPTTQVNTKCGSVWNTTRFFRNLKCDKYPSAATISGYGRYEPNCINRDRANFGKVNRNANKNGRHQIYCQLKAFCLTAWKIRPSVPFHCRKLCEINIYF